IYHKETLFVWDVCGRWKLLGDQFDIYEKFGNLVMTQLGYKPSPSTSLKDYFTTRDEFRSLRDVWFIAFDQVNAHAKKKFEDMPVPTHEFSGFFGDAEDEELEDEEQRAPTTTL
ncbi:hypothetical protein HDU76_010455, partial [Blyttiomyces sp. JEL0837]